MKSSKDVTMAGGGLYANIAAKKKRIAAGSGEKMRSAGSAGAPKKSDFANAAKTASYKSGGLAQQAATAIAMKDKGIKPKKMAEGGKSTVNSAGNYTKPELRKRIFNAVKAEATAGTGARDGQPEKPKWLHKGRKKLAAGIVIKAPQQSLKNWGDQKWRTKSGKPSSKTGERYLPEKAIKSLSSQEYAATTKAKRAGKAAGKQFVAQPKAIAKKTAGFR